MKKRSNYVAIFLAVVALVTAGLMFGSPGFFITGLVIGAIVAIQESKKSGKADLNDITAGPPVVEIAKTMETQQLKKMPQQVTIAINMMLAVLLLTIGGQMMDLSHAIATEKDTPYWVHVAAIPINILITLFLVYKIYPGKNWARWIYLIVIAPNALAVLAVGEVFQRSTPLGLAYVAVGILSSAIVFLLFFSPGKLWFRRQALPTERKVQTEGEYVEDAKEKVQGDFTTIISASQKSDVFKDAPQIADLELPRASVKNKNRWLPFAIGGVVIVALLIIFQGVPTAPSTGKAVSGVSELQCKVVDSNIGAAYKGDCKDGFAHGFGVAKGRDTYTGNFKNGLTHGQGKYEWGPSSESPDEVWEGLHYKGGRTGYGVLTLGPKSRHILDNTGNYAGGDVGTDGRRSIHAAWARGNQSTSFGKCKSEAECYRALATLETGLKPLVESALKSKLKDGVVTLAEIPYMFVPKNKAPDPLITCLTFENLDVYKESNSRVLLDAQDLANLVQAAVEPKHLLSSLLDCEARVRSNENFQSKMNPYQGIATTELRASLKWLVGKKVEVSGNVVSIMSRLVFKDGPEDMNPIILNTDRTDRKTIIEGMESCTANPIHGCVATISGTVSDTDSGLGISLEKITVTKKAQAGVY
jgi:hypothetical protein